MNEQENTRIVRQSYGARLAVAFSSLILVSVGALASPPDGSQFLQLTNSVDCGNQYPTFNASGNRLVFESSCGLAPGGNEIFLMDSDGSNVVQLTSGPSGGIGNAWVNASGKRVAFASERDLVAGQNSDGNGEIFVMNVNGSDLRQLTFSVGPGELGSFLPALDYAGKRVFFVSMRNLVGGGTTGLGSEQIFVVNIDGTGLQQLTFGGENSSSPSVDAAGNVYFVGPGERLYRMNSDGSGVVQLAPAGVTGHHNEKTGVDAGGRRLVFTSVADLVQGGNSDGTREVFLLDLATGTITQITSTTTGGLGLGSRTPSISANGRTVVLSSDGDFVGSNSDRNPEIFIADLP